MTNAGLLPEMAMREWVQRRTDEIEEIDDQAGKMVEARGSMHLPVFQQEQGRSVREINRMRGLLLQILDEKLGPEEDVGAESNGAATLVI